MAQIKIVITIESTYVRDAHAAIDAADAYLRLHEGRVVHARLVPVQEAAREPDPEPAPVSRCSVCNNPAHPSETDDLDRCATCHGAVGCECGEWSGEHCTWRGNDDERMTVEFMPEQFRSSHVAANNRGSYPGNGSRRVRVSQDCGSEMLTHDGEWCEEIEEDAADDIEECADCGASTADGTPSPHECAPAMPESDAAMNAALARDVAALPAHNGWTVAWEHPGYLAFYRKGSPSVLATPDYHERGQIAVEVRYATQDVSHDDIAWPRDGRTPEGFLALVRPVLDRIEPPVVEGDDIFEGVMAAMQPAEERGGPDGAQYVALMERIAHEAQRRANVVRDTLAGTAEEVRS